MNLALYIAEEQTARLFAKEIKEVLLELDPSLSILELQDKELDKDNWDNEIQDFSTHRINCLIAVGGTGTFLRAIFLCRNSIPIVSASSESISFFTEINPLNVHDTLQALLSRKYDVDNYNQIVFQDLKSNLPVPALNEIAIFPKDSALLMNYTLIVDKNQLYRGRADGVIISTALGSTGYALSSGGPIAYGNPDIIIVVPVNPLSKDHIPLVLQSSSEVKLVNMKSRSQIEVIIDGQLRLQADDEVVIRKSSSTAKIMRFQAKRNILAKLRNRLVELDLRNLQGVPPSAKYIFKLLLTEGEMTQKELIEGTGLPNRTVRNALAILKGKGVINQRPHLRDARQSIYYVE
ncbi:MAG: NAD(+)/NADH kinase [Candidatus Heimdallarchaeaceae archaeon]